MADLRIERYDHCDRSQVDAIATFVDDVELAGKRTDRPYSVLLYDVDGNIVGGASGVTSWGLCEVSVLGIDRRFRGLGWGRKLVEAIEETARERSCRFIHTNTMNFQAIDFYVHVGFFVQAELTDDSREYTRYFIAKEVT